MSQFPKGIIVSEAYPAIIKEVNMKDLSMIQGIEKEFHSAVKNPAISVSLMDFFMEAGFEAMCSAEEKAEFYKGVAAFVDYFYLIAEALGEKNAYVGNFVKNESNFYKWKNIRQFDSYNDLRSCIKPNETKQITVKNNHIIDMIIECNFRYLSDLVFFFPDSHIFVRPDVHCWFEISGNIEQLEKLYEKLKKHPKKEFSVVYRTDL